ncbi:MAG: YdeI/OmpD-associated family protein [Actinomycetota bacterium]
MPSFDERLGEIHPETRAEWRSWLADHHDMTDGIWLIYHRASTGRRRLSWEDAVREALCFGWIDSKVKPIDDERYRQIFTPRKPRSVWSKINKEYVDELVEAGLMTEAGLRAIELAKENGAWSFLEPIDDLIVPDDLASALRGSPSASAAYEALSNSAKRAILYSLYSAKRDETRARRVAAALADLEADR